MAESYVGVFEVPTPAVAHSGLSHLAEHLCFRGSTAYPADHNLFVINHLLPASINASTLAAHTYFFVTTTHQQLFHRLLDYLYQGLVQHQYRDEVITQEQLGVLVQELQMHESNPDYALNAAIRRGDTCAQRYQHAGGFTDTITCIDTNDVQTYKATYYQADQIRLYTNGQSGTLPPHLQSLIHRLPEATSTTFTPDFGRLEAKVKATLAQCADPSSRVLTWWLPASYLASVQSTLSEQQADFDALGRIWVDEEINSNNQVALRLVLNEQVTIEHATHSINENLAQLQSSELARPDGTEKLPDSVRELIQLAIRCRTSSHTLDKNPATTLEQSNAAAPFSLSQITPELSNLHPLSPMTPSKTNSIRLEPQTMLGTDVNQTVPTISTEFSNLLSLDHLPALPKLFQSMLKKADGKLDGTTPLIHQTHWLQPIEPSDSLLQAMMESAFWSIRLKGECYALGVGQFEGKCYLYCAQDGKIATRFAENQTA